MTDVDSEISTGVDAVTTALSTGASIQLLSKTPARIFFRPPAVLAEDLSEFAELRVSSCAAAVDGKKLTSELSPSGGVDLSVVRRDGTKPRMSSGCVGETNVVDVAGGNLTVKLSLFGDGFGEIDAADVTAENLMVELSVSGRDGETAGINGTGGKLNALFNLTTCTALPWLSNRRLLRLP